MVQSGPDAEEMLRQVSPSFLAGPEPPETRRKGEKTAVNLWFRTGVYHEELYQKMEEQSGNSYK